MGFKENLNKKLYLEKSGKHGAKKQEHGAKKQELFNCLLFHFSHVSYVSHLVTFFRILKTQFSIFSNAFSKRIFRFFQKTVKKCEQGAFWKCTWKKCEKWVLKMHLEKCEKLWKMGKKDIWNPVGKMELWFFSSGLIFLGPVLLQLLCCLPNFCGLNIRENRSEVDCADRRSV